MKTSRMEKITKIIKTESSLQEKRKKIKHIAHCIFLARSEHNRAEDESCNFVPIKKEVSLQEFIYKWGNWFVSRQIPFEYWSDICEEGLELTLKFIESGLEDCKEMEGCNELVEKHFDRINELHESDKYGDDEKMAWNDMGW